MKKILVVILFVTVLVSCNQEKTAYVDNVRLVQDYIELQEREKEFEAKSELLRQEFDSIGRDFQAQVQQYQVQAQTMSEEERQSAEGNLMELQQKLQRQQQTRSNELRSESEVVMDSLVTKVKDFVAAYGKENNYTYIFGSNETANILYAEEGRDITEEILEALNKNYQNE